MKDFLSTKNMTKDEILGLLDTAEAFRELSRRDVKKAPTLKGKTVLNVFFENSTRTRTSFELAAKRLSADAVNFTASNSSTQKGETLIDTIQNLEAMQSDIMIVRHSCSGSVHFIAENTKSAVINAGDGLNEHPTQAMLDLMTIKRAKHEFEGLTATIMGDITHSRVARSNIWAMKTLGMKVKLFGPPTVLPNDMSPFGCHVCSNIEEAIEDSDVVMALRIQRERQGKLLIPSVREYSAFFGLSPKHLQIMKKDALIMHPGPINRGVEISSYMADHPQSVILDQVENGVAIRMALLCMVKKEG
ncbi:MAG: aspartate carbamoyltransferase catalytic subunit [Deferribacteraceae bacterium]|jgi:aspartate carbamoyltransferase catalytic subunit|nr:aspartate carbamoyltransferase catalytic subunit [Deferribacteraceae bacterium]